VRFFDRLQPLALLLLRVVVGVIMIAHGKGKIFGGLGKHMAFVSSLGLPHWLGVLSASTEFFGGILLIAGLLTRLVGVAFCIEMCVAIAKVHFKNGLTSQGGYEYPLSLAAISFALIWFGAGPISLDWLFGGHKGKV
jgi:putative oxidoreductase